MRTSLAGRVAARSPFLPSHFAVAIATFGVCASVQAAPGPIGTAFVVDQITTSTQSEAAIATNAQGDFVVAWTHVFSEVDYDIHARVFRADGTPRSGEIGIATPSAVQRLPAVAMDPNGDFVVAWQSYLPGQDGSDAGVLARRYDAAGNPGPTVPVNAWTTGAQAQASVAMDAGGNFVVVWQSNGQDGSGQGVFARRFDSASVAQGTDIAVNVATIGDQGFPAVATDAAGDFLVAWSAGNNQDGNGEGIFARRFNSAGAATSGEMRVNTTTQGGQYEAHAAMDAAGDLSVVTWTGPDGSGDGVFAQRLSASVRRVGPELPVDVTTSGWTYLSTVAMDASGGFAIAWTSEAYGVLMRPFDAQGAPLAAPFPVKATNGVPIADIGMDADGDAVVAWSEYEVDGSNYGIAARRYRGSETVDLDVQLDAAMDRALAGESIGYVATLSNLHPLASPSGNASVDAAVGSALGSAISIVLPTGATLGSAPTLDVPGTCSARAAGYLCRTASPLAAAQQAHASFALAAPVPGPIVAVARATTQSADDRPENDADRATVDVECNPGMLAFTGTSYTGDEDIGIVSFGVVRSGGDCGAASVQFDTAPFSALPGADFTDVAGVLSWAPGETGVKTFDVPVSDDSLDEVDEQFEARLSGATGAQLATPSRAVARIIDDDGSPRVNFSATGITKTENAALVTVTAVLGAVSGRDVAIPLTFGGTATRGTDYYAANARIVIPAGQTRGTTGIEIVDDTEVESGEKIVIGMGTPVGALKGSLSTCTITVKNDDGMPGGRGRRHDPAGR